jgi:23S rRNA pseudouridine2605 synthase
LEPQYQIVRLNRYLAASGLGSRRSCEEIILAGRVSINGTFIRSLATTVNEGDDVRVSGRRVTPPKTFTLLAVNKPEGYLSTHSDERGRKTVYDLLPDQFSRLFHIGRLDMESDGLMLLTDDGDLAQSLSHPTRKVEKEYEVTLNKELDPACVPKLLKGFMIEGGRARMESIRVVGPSRVKVILTQGIKRQIRLMFYKMEREVLRLTRTRIGTVRLGALKPGGWKILDARDISKLRESTGPLKR